MSEVKFTKGPWAIEYDNADEYGGNQWYNVGPAKVVISYAISATEREEWDANAHLIAAAPEMYEALESALRLLNVAGLSDRIGYAEGINALAKARGES